LTWLVVRKTLAWMARMVKQSKAVKRTGMYDVVLDDIVDLIEIARRRAARMVNATMTAVYWSIGRRIVVEEQRGARRAEYGEELIKQLALRLTARFGRGFGPVNLSQMRAFYLTYREILQTASEKSERGDVGGPILQTASEKFEDAETREILQTASGESAGGAGDRILQAASGGSDLASISGSGSISCSSIAAFAAWSSSTSSLASSTTLTPARCTSTSTTPGSTGRSPGRTRRWA
jgi:hypothetical protein